MRRKGRIRNHHASGRTPYLLADKPEVPPLWHLVLKTKERVFWIRSSFDEYDRNHEFTVYSKPIRRSDLPEDAVVIPSILVPGVKCIAESSTGGKYYTFAPRHCGRGSSVKKEDIPLYRGNPVATPHGFRQVIANAAAYGDIIIVYDITNAFQHTLRSLERRKVYITPGPHLAHIFAITVT